MEDVFVAELKLMDGSKVFDVVVTVDGKREFLPAADKKSANALADAIEKFAMGYKRSD